MGNLGILAASCAGICSPCKLYDVQCLCNITIWQGGPERTGALPGALPCYAFGCPTVLPPISAPLFRFHMSSAPRARRLPGPRSGLAEGTPGPSDRTPLHSQPPVTCASSATFSSSCTAIARTPHHPYHRSSALSTRCNLGSSVHFLCHALLSPNIHLPKK